MNIHFHNNRAGSSLVEVLVTMSVLAFGILVMIQMFPSGFSVVKSAEQRTVGAKLAQAEIDKWISRADNLPDGFLPVGDDGEPPIDDYPVPRRGAQLTTFEPTGSGTYARGNVLNLRMVMGETISISEASFFETAQGTTFGSRYMLAYGPVDTFRYDDSGMTVLHRFAVKSEDMRRMPEDMAPSNGRQYSIDYEPGSSATFNIAFARNNTGHTQLYYITYSYWASNGSHNRMVTKVNQEIFVPDGYDGSWLVPPPQIQGTPAGYSFVEMVPFSEKVARGYRLLQGSDWTSDPYEFTLSDSLLGLVAFNPRARQQGNGRAKVDYLIYDPRILAEDVVVPQASSGRIAVKLPLRFLLDSRSPNIGDGMDTQNPDEPKFEGLMRLGGYSNTGDPIPALGIRAMAPDDLLINGAILVIDVSTGLLVDPDGVDFGQGVVYINAVSDLRDRASSGATLSGIPMAGRRVRIYYRASGDWVIQMSKAFARYTRSSVGSVNYSEFAQDPSDARRLYFSKLYAGHSVLVDYTFGGNEDHKVSGENYRISDDYINGFCYIDLKEVPDRIYAVVGASVRARVMWRDTHNWRLQDSESLIMRSGAGE